jgi:hypothetical protein
MAQTAAQRKRAQRARDRARLGDDEFKRIKRDKMRAYRASKAAKNPKPKTTIIMNNQPQTQLQPVQPQVQSNPSKNKKAPQQLIRAPQQVVKQLVPMYKSPNATPISDNSINTYLSQFKKYLNISQKKIQ